MRVYVDSPEGMELGLYCEVAANAIEGQLDSLLVGTPGGNAVRTNVPMLAPGQRVTIRMRRQPDRLECRLLTGGTTSGFVVLDRGVEIFPTDRFVGLLATRTALQLESVAIYER